MTNSLSDMSSFGKAVERNGEPYIGFFILIIAPYKN